MQNMPQDSLRSAVYRSFVTCDDPKGVVECRTIRKSKNDSKKMEGKAEGRRTAKNLKTTPSYKEENEMVCKGTTEELQNPSSFQLMEVSRGAQKLNQVIDSWSKGMNFEGQSKDNAIDLLRGALDLQESLVMLSKLQEASHYMAKLKKKQKEKAGGGRANDVGIEKTNSNKFGDHNYQMGFQGLRLSADGSSRDCYEELRRVIRDSLARQNLLPKGSSEETPYFDRRKLDSSPDISSSSSSQSSMVNSHYSGSANCSLSSKVPLVEPKGPNLIAKLMGLEEIPSKLLSSTPLKPLGRDKVLNQRRPFFDIDMPKTTMPQFVVRKLDREQKTLEEIIETVQFKGLVERNKHQTHHSITSPLEKRFTDGAPPIVLIKPLRSPTSDAEDFGARKIIWEAGAFDTEDMVKKWKIKEDVPPKAIHRRKGASDSSEMCRNLKVEETPIKRLSQEKGAKDCKEILAETEGKELKIKEKLSTKMKASVPKAIPQKKEVIEKKGDKIQKVTPNRRKPGEMDSAKSRSAPKSYDHSKVVLKKQRKPESISNISRNWIPQHKSTMSNSSSKRTTSTVSHNSTRRKKNVKNEKPASKSLTVNVENIGHKDDDMQIDRPCENESDITTTITTPVVQPLTEEGTYASEICTRENCNNSHNFLSATALPTTGHESSTKSTEEANYCTIHDRTEGKFCQTRPNLKDLLLSSPSFLSYAEELFDINGYHHAFLQTTSVRDSEIANSRLLLDCANELLARKSLQYTSMVHTVLQNPMSNPTICISLDQLASEVCDGIENLRSHSKLVCDRLPVDTVYAVLERDLWCKGVASGAWDVGWRNGFIMDEVQQSLGDLEKLVLSGLIEEVLTDFVPRHFIHVMYLDQN